MEPYDGFMVHQVLDAHWGVLNDEDVSMLLPVPESSELVAVVACEYVTF